ncbi:hypothetical protein D3C80_1072800 [compost metagenome]
MVLITEQCNLRTKIRCLNFKAQVLVHLRTMPINGASLEEVALASHSLNLHSPLITGECISVASLQLLKELLRDVPTKVKVVRMVLKVVDYFVEVSMLNWQVSCPSPSSRRSLSHISHILHKVFDDWQDTRCFTP